MIKESFMYMSSDVNKDAVMSFMSNCKENKTDVHSLVIIKDGEVKVKVAPTPYSFDYKQQLYSLSKSFSSTAIGFLYDEGIVDIEDRMIDIFADKCPENVSENISKMKLKHVLSMNTGHGGCVLGGIRGSQDPVREFFEREPEHEPGSFFMYNNAATFMLSEIVAKYTGMTMYDYLYIKLFKPLGITGVHWDTFADGNSQGAVGLHVSAEDISKFGLMYLNKGVYEGKRILSEKWCELAVKPWSDNSDNGTPDWTAGYGFQFWVNARDGFRGDGAFGQLCVVLPKYNAVLATEVFSDDMQKEMEYVYEVVENLIGESTVTDDKFKEFLDGYNTPAKYEGVKDDFFGNMYKCEKNAFGVTFVEIDESADSVDVTFSDGECRQTVNFGKNKFVENSVVIRKLKPTLEGLCGCEDKLNVHFAAYASSVDGKLHLNMNYLDNPHLDDYVFEADEKSLYIHKAAPSEFSYDGEIKGELV